LRPEEVRELPSHSIDLGEKIAKELDAAEGEEQKEWIPWRSPKKNQPYNQVLAELLCHELLTPPLASE
jgi:hypothetical protein